MLYILSYLLHSKLSHTNVVYPPLTCGTLTLAIQMLYTLFLPVALQPYSYKCCISSSYLWHSKLSHTNVVYPPLSCGTLKLAIKCCSQSPSHPWHSKHSHANVVYPLVPVEL